MRTRATSFVVLVLAVASPVAAASFHLTPDAPVSPTGVTILPWEIALYNGAYGVQAGVAAGTTLDALHQMNDGSWLLSVESPTTLGGATYRRDDIVRYDGVSFSLFFSGSGAGVPIDSDIDAVFLDGGDTGHVIVSFDVPAILGGTLFEPSDLVDISSAVPAAYFDASAATPPIPVSSNVTGADFRAGLLVLTFDVPTTLGATTYTPGQLVSWNGSSFAQYHSDTAWSAGRVNGLSLLAGPGNVSNLSVDLSAATGNLILSWDASCSVGGEDYAIFEGVLGDWSSHTAIDCSDNGGDLTESVPLPADDRYYLVVPHNAAYYGSFGLNSALEERPVGTAVCAPAQALTMTCP